ncbi:MAG: hypothetical protein NDI93_00500 [Pseudomonas sp.]|nr:hypothetical protein [Pseudomonas sp.]
MATFLFRPTSKLAARMQPFARRLAKSLKDGRGAASQVIDGFILRAVGNGRVVTVHVIEPGCILGGGFGNVWRLVSQARPYEGRMAALISHDAMPLGNALSVAEDANPSASPGKFFRTSAGVKVGSAPGWSAQHGTLPGSSPRAAVVPSALMMPSVAGASSNEKLAKAPPSARTVVIQRVNAATELDSTASTYALPYTPSASPLVNEAGPNAIGHIELAPSALNLPDERSPRNGSMACLEWGPLEGLVLFQAQTEAIPVSEVVEISPGSSDGTYAGADYAYPIGQAITYNTYPVLAYVDGPGADEDEAAFCARYSIAVADGTDADGLPIKLYTPSLLWTARLDGSGASGDLARPTPPATTNGWSVVDGTANTPTAWRDLWRMENILVWSDHAGEVGGHAKPGEVIFGIGTVLIRQFRPISKRKVSYGGQVANDPWLRPETIVETVSATMTYHDRHTVRFTIDPQTGSVTYQSLNKLVNCYNDKGNDCGGHDGVTSKYPWMTKYYYSLLGVDQLAAYDIDVLEGYEHFPLTGFTQVTPGEGGESRESFIACWRKRTLYEVLPSAQDYPARLPEPGIDGRAQLGPVWLGNYSQYQVAEEGEVYLFQEPFRDFPGHPASFPYRVEKRNASKDELIESNKVVVIGRTGSEMVMQTGSYYPDVDRGPDLPARKEVINRAYAEYLPDRVDTGSPVCHYAPGIIAIVVIPKAQFPEPRAEWPWPPQHISPQASPPLISAPDYTYYPPANADEDYAAWKAADDAQYANLSAEPDTPAPVAQDRYLALCSVHTGELLAVSSRPIYTGTALQDTPKSRHRSAAVSLSCVEMGAVNEQGSLIRHAILLISVREPPSATWNSAGGSGQVPTSVMITDDFAESVRPICRNDLAIPAHYLGTPLKAAKIGVTTGVSAVRGKAVTPE